MRLENRFTVPVPVDQAWEVLLDVERIAPCMPGAAVTARSGDDFEGTVKVKVGPINLTYGGKARFSSRDAAARVAVIDASGKETRGTGTARATITCRLHDRGGSTEVEVGTDLAITGKPAQFGRGVLADVSGKLVDQFAACLSEEILSGTVAAAAQGPTPTGAGTGTGTPAPAAAPGGAAAPGAEAAGAPAAGPAATGPADSGGVLPPPAVAGTASPAPAGAATPRRPAEPIDLLGTAGAPVAKRLVPVVVGVLLIAWIVRRLTR